MVELALRARAPGAADGDPPISATRWGVYAFYDFEDEPIYVGQTNESLRVRIRRHLTNQRTDAVGMRVLDPYEIMSIEMWPLTEFGSAAGAIEVVTGSGRVVATYPPGCDVVEEIRSRAVLPCRPARPRSEQLELGLES